MGKPDRKRSLKVTGGHEIQALRIGFLKQEFVPDQAVVSRQIIEGLRDQGATVRVITGTATTVLGDRSPGAPRLPVIESWNGFEIRRIPFLPSHDSSAVRRAATYGTFGTASTLVAPWAFKELDVLLVYGSPATAAAAALVWTRRLGLPYVLYVQDLWPDSVFATGFLRSGEKQERFARWLLNAFVDSVYRRADAIVAISPGIRQKILDRGVAPEKVHTVYNWAVEEVFKPAPRIEHDGHVLMYAGTLGFAQDLHTVLDALSRVRTADTRLILIGTGPAEESLRARVHSQGMANVEFLGRLTPIETRERMRAADLLLVPLADEPLFRITLPSKVQAILASGMPLVVSAPGEAGRMVVDAEAGFAVPPGDPGALARTIDSALNLPAGQLTAMGMRGRRFYEANCSAAQGAARLYQVLSTASSSRRKKH